MMFQDAAAKEIHLQGGFAQFGLPLLFIALADAVELLEVVTASFEFPLSVPKLIQAGLQLLKPLLLGSLPAGQRYSTTRRKLVTAGPPYKKPRGLPWQVITPSCTLQTWLMLTAGSASTCFQPVRSFPLNSSTSRLGSLGVEHDTTPNSTSTPHAQPLAAFVISFVISAFSGR